MILCSISDGWVEQALMMILSLASASILMFEPTYQSLMVRPASSSLDIPEELSLAAPVVLAPNDSALSVTSSLGWSGPDSES